MSVMVCGIELYERAIECEPHRDDGDRVYTIEHDECRVPLMHPRRAHARCIPKHIPSHIHIHIHTPSPPPPFITRAHSLPTR
jgi:hypothetical protein